MKHLVTFCIAEAFLASAVKSLPLPHAGTEAGSFKFIARPQESSLPNNYYPSSSSSSQVKKSGRSLVKGTGSSLKKSLSSLTSRFKKQEPTIPAPVFSVHHDHRPYVINEPISTMTTTKAASSPITKEKASTSSITKPLRSVSERFVNRGKSVSSAKEGESYFIGQNKDPLAEKERKKLTRASTSTTAAEVVDSFLPSSSIKSSGQAPKKTKKQSWFAGNPEVRESNQRFLNGPRSPPHSVRGRGAEVEAKNNGHWRR